MWGSVRCGSLEWWSRGEWGSSTPFFFFCVVVFCHTPKENVLKLPKWFNSMHADFLPPLFGWCCSLPPCCGVVVLSCLLRFGWWCFPIRCFWVVVLFSASFLPLLLLGGGTLSFPSLRGVVSLLLSLTWCNTHCSIRLCHWVGADVSKLSSRRRSKAPPPEGGVGERCHHPKRGGGESTATQRWDRKAAQLKGGKGKSPPSFLRGDLSLLQKKRC